MPKGIRPCLYNKHKPYVRKVRQPMAAEISTKILPETHGSKGKQHLKQWHSAASNKQF